MDAPVNALSDALVHARAGRLPEAEAAYAAILAADPDQPDACLHLGLLLLRDGRPGAAAPLLAAAADARAGDARVRLRLAEAHLAHGDAQAGLRAVEDAARLAPERAEGCFLRGAALNALGRQAEAEAALRRAVGHRPDHAESHLNLGNALADLDRLDDALSHIRRAAALAPDLAEAWTSLGCALIAAGRLTEAAAACERAVAIRPDLARAHWNLGIASLLGGGFALGWEKYEWRFLNDPARRGLPSLPGPVWDGGPLHGRRIAVCAEQGLGDAIQFSRYLPLLAGLGGVATLVCAPGLIPLLGAMPCIAAAVPKGGPVPGYDVWVDQMSLPRRFGTEADTIPAAEGYLSPRWRKPAAAGTRRVGVVWAGNPAHSNDRRRSLPRAQLAALRGAPVEWVSLQAGPRAGEAADLGAADLSARLTDYAVTARIVAGLDLVVTIDSSVAHLAGALGCPVWVMLPHAPDWRWMLVRDDSPWYASMRLFRQEAPGAWQGVIARVLGALRATGGLDACGDAHAKRSG